MRTGINITVTPDDRRRLEGIVSDLNRSLKHIAPHIEKLCIKLCARDERSR